jgi:uncharacterized protein YyaL (SSP411 family)
MSDREPAINDPTIAGHRYTNRLIHETSPYLLQHAHNPVDWYPWGDEALQRARAEDKPIVLSVGYAACHWCHVMERESFENERIAAIMNLHYVCIKVDREERPDIDALYMDAVQALTGQGGWPMTVFLTPQTLPFFAGTYFPPDDRYGMPGFGTILLRLSQMYRTQRSRIDEQAEEFRRFYAQRGSLTHVTQRIAPIAASEVDLGVLSAAQRGLSRSFDPSAGGFGTAPKFPHVMDLEFLLRMQLREQQIAPRAEVIPGARPEVTPLAIVTSTLDHMATGGIFDHLGGGFHRYTVDDRWQIPHFEKMLYDNALLARIYLHAYQVTGDERYARVCRETLDYVRREMTSPEGGFYATQDADSDGQEGKFYVWTPEEIHAVLDADDAALFSAIYGVTDEGNFEHSGATVLHLAQPVAEAAAAHGLTIEDAEQRLADARMALYAARSRRIWPGLDDKIVTAWNGLMIRAFAEAAEAFDSVTYAEAATNSAAFLLERLRDENGRLLRTYRSGRAHIAAYLEDYAALTLGLLATYEATFELRWYEAAVALADEMIAWFADESEGGFFDTASDHEQFVGRPRDLTDGAIPAGNSLAVEALLWLAALTGEQHYRVRAETILLALAPVMAQQPLAYGHFLCDLDRWLSPSQEIAIIGDSKDDDTVDMLATFRSRYRPNAVIACAPPGDRATEVIPLLRDREQLMNVTTVYVCSGFACQLPVTDPAALAVQLGDA